MAILYRYRVVWSGGPGGEGVSTFYSDEPSTAPLGALHDFFDTIKAQFPSVITWSFPGSGDVIEATTGALAGDWTTSTPAPIQGGGVTSSFAAGVGARVRWNTDGLAGGRRVRGATFLTSLVTNAYEPDGTISAGALSVLQGAADTLAGTGYLSIWSRGDGTNGSFHSVTSGVVVDRVSWLSTRRT